MKNSSAQTRIHTLKIQRVESLTPQSKALIFDKNALPTPHAGQYLTLLTTPHKTELRRAYSVFTYDEDCIAIGVKKVPGGVVSNFLHHQAREGLEIKIMGPLGQFYYEPKHNTYAHLLLIAGGSGITPILAILKAALTQHESQPNVTLLYVNNSLEDTMFRKELDQLAHTYSARFTLIHYLNTENIAPRSVPRPGLLGKLGLKKTEYTAGFITAEKIKTFTQAAPRSDSTGVFICGPKGLMDLTESTLIQDGQPHATIKKENFTASNTTPVKPNFNPPNCTATVTLNGARQQFHIPSGKSILQAAAESSVELPYACREGSCTACYSRCTSGAIQSMNDDNLSDDELAEGGFLPCVAYPKSKTIEFSID